MSGHSKFANIKHRKEAQDKKRGQIFSRLAKDISIAARSNPDTASNPTLRTVIDKAKTVNMPKDKIERAIAKAIGHLGNKVETFTYGAYGPGGSGIIIEGATDNKNRTLAKIRHILNKNNASMAEINALSWMFEKSQTDQGLRWQIKAPLKLSAGDQVKLKELVSQLEENEDVNKVIYNG